MMPRWVERIEVQREPTSEPALAATYAFFDPLPEQIPSNDTITLSGQVYHGADGLENVHISIDDHEPLPLPIAGAPFQFADWSVNWIPPTKGTFTLAVQASGRGNSHAQNATHNVFRRNDRLHRVSVEVV
jgi:hypothetical protein